MLDPTPTTEASSSTNSTTSKRARKPFPLADDASDASYDDNGAESDASYSEKAPPTKKVRTKKQTSEPSTAGKATTTAKQTSTLNAKLSAFTATGVCSLSKKDFGDKIKECLRLEKYEIQSMSFNLKMDAIAFRSYFGTAGIHIAPKTFDDDAEVVVATLNNSQAGTVFGVSKIKNGNRYSTYHLRRMCVVLYPKTQTATVWLTV